MTSPLVSTVWLADHLNDSNLIVLDASMDKVVGKEKRLYEQQLYIPNSLRCDLEQVLCDTQSLVANAFPTAAQGQAFAQANGITANSTVIVYDDQGIYSAPRAWWVLRQMGVAQVFILDGGLPQWLAEGRAVVDSVVDNMTDTSAAPQVTSSYSGVCDQHAVLASLANNSATIIDARAQARFSGQAAEPREGMRSGHIPGSLNLPFAQVLSGFCFKPASELQALMAALLEDRPQPLIFSCGSGITACIIMAAAHIAGFTNTVLYDGSWAQWGADDSLPIA